MRVPMERLKVWTRGIFLVHVDNTMVLANTDDGLWYAVTTVKSLYEIRISNDVEWFLGVKVDCGATCDQLD